MDVFSRRKPSSHRESQCRRRSWCCPFTDIPSSPDNFTVFHQKTIQNRSKSEKRCDSISKVSKSVPNSPQNYKSGFPSRINPRGIKSPGRVSPIDPDHPVPESIQEIESNSTVATDSWSQFRPPSFRAPLRTSRALPEASLGSSSSSRNGAKDGYDVRLNLKGKNGGCLVLELNSEVLSVNSEVFAGLILEHRKGLADSSRSPGAKTICRIEVPDVENLGLFRETIELMFEEDIARRLVKIGVYRSIDILEVSAGIMFNKGVLSALKYLEAVPWTEEEEEKVRSLFTRFKFDDTTTRDILARLYLLDSDDSQENLARQLVCSVTACADANARNELKTLVKGLLCKSSVYEKDNTDLNKEDLYVVCQSCLASLLSLFEESSGTTPGDELGKETGRPMIERISRQVDNITWLLEILLDRQMAEEFVDMWADQGPLLKMHESASPMVRYEVSRVSAMLFIAMGTRKMHCPSESRSGLLQAWFGPMLYDFGWLHRCRKGLEIKVLEEAMGQTLLTLPLNQQYTMFMQWFQCFSKHGTECPNLSKAFQIWWRRSFLRGSETFAIESR